MRGTVNIFLREMKHEEKHEETYTPDTQTFNKTFTQQTP